MTKPKAKSPLAPLNLEPQNQKPKPLESQKPKVSEVVFKVWMEHDEETGGRILRFSNTTTDSKGVVWESSLTGRGATIREASSDVANQLYASAIIARAARRQLETDGVV